MMYVWRCFLLALFLAAICLVGAMAHTSIHKINRVSDGQYEFVFYPLLGWRLSAVEYYSVAGVASVIVATGGFVLWRKWRGQKSEAASLSDRV